MDIEMISITPLKIAARQSPAELSSGECSASALTAVRLTINGRVQGLGVRPAIHRLATSLSLAGTVRNTFGGVEIELEGTAAALSLFDEQLPASLPPAARITEVRRQGLSPRGRRGFSIVKEPAHGPVRVAIPEDRAICPDCAREVRDPSNRRWRYPLISCTCCGPRYTIIRSMPFEREDSALVDFPLCEPCRSEYEQPADRRFHAQTTACQACGPRVCAADAAGSVHQDYEAVRVAVAALRAGKIVALRGIGGYQLLVDATNSAAVDRLRQRKRRPAKPLAVMAPSLSAAQRLGCFDAAEREAFQSDAAPIVLVRARAGGRLASGIAPHLDVVGLMKPTSALHQILAERFGGPLVCTSGNRDGDPLEYEVKSAEDRLNGIADLWLHHDRSIVRPIDDSVVRVIAGRAVTIRLARGLAPLSLDLPPSPPIVAVGGYLKAAIACSNGVQAALAPHLGDQGSLAARQRFLAHLADWQRLYRFSPQSVAHDMHPDYFSTRWAQSQPWPTIAVQHHHAHVAAAMLENGLLQRRVLGVSWDGTGYGPDGSVWGGEFLEATATGFHRVATLRPFRLPGGEAAIHEPWRCAVAVVQQLNGSGDLSNWPGWSIDPKRIDAVRRMVDKPRLAPVTTSAGRLIDAAAALVLGIERAEYDGQPAMRLEAVADRTEPGEYDLPVTPGAPLELDWRPLFTQLLAEFERGVDPPVLAMRFHRTLARGILRVAQRYPQLPLVLTGGVFQSRLLTELAAEYYDNALAPLILPGLIPPNDGGLAAGQLAIASVHYRSSLCV